MFKKTLLALGLCLAVSASAFAAVTEKVEQGKKYNVTVKFFGEDGKGGAGYVDPEAPGDLDGNGNADDDKGKKIIGGVIKFNATVSDWDTKEVIILL